MLKGIRHLSFEIGPRCNRASEHAKCPASVMKRDGESASVETIVETVQWALDNGFDGWVGFHYYCEPMLYVDRMQEVIDAVPEARYCLWTNGYNHEHPIVGRFDKIFLSDYDNRENYPFDRRIHNYEPLTPPFQGECWRPLIEVPIDYEGNIHLCCQDWRGDTAIGNFEDWLAKAEACVEGDLPAMCSNCRHPLMRKDYLKACKESGQTPRGSK